MLATVPRPISASKLPVGPVELAEEWQSGFSASPPSFHFLPTGTNANSSPQQTSYKLNSILESAVRDTRQMTFIYVFQWN